MFKPQMLFVKHMLCPSLQIAALLWDLKYFKYSWDEKCCIYVVVSQNVSLFLPFFFIVNSYIMTRSYKIVQHTEEQYVVSITSLSGIWLLKQRGLVECLALKIMQLCPTEA